jgi:hypothetical protein
VIDNIQAVSPQPSAQKVNPSNANNKDEEFQEFRPPLSPDIANMLQRMKLCYLATKLGTKPHGRPLQLAPPSPLQIDSLHSLPDGVHVCRCRGSGRRHHHEYETFLTRTSALRILFL